jgi:alpha,alpha-trehalose phosphorylase
MEGSFRIDGVTGPDEYSALSDNNIYTNLMAARNLNGAAAACERHRDKAHELRVTPEEMADWRSAAEHMFIPFDRRLGVHPQSSGFTDHEMWDFEKTKPDQYPLMLHFPYFDLYRKQVVKQPDLVLAMQLCCGSFTAEQKARNFNYYERITVRDSSLSACTQAVMAAEVGHLRLALDYTAEAALLDLHDLEHNARDGLHIASLAGTWIAFVNGFGGMRDHEDVLMFSPQLPDGLTSLAFSIVRRGMCLRVEVTPDKAVYRLTQGTGPIRLVHHGEAVTLTGSDSRSLRIPPTEPREPPEQPPGREPQRRSPGGKA